MHRWAAVVCFQYVLPLRTQDAFTCNVTRLPLFLTSASVAAGVIESRVRAWGWGRGCRRLLAVSWRRNVWHSLSLSVPRLCACKTACSHLLDPPPLCCLHHLHHTPDPPPGTPSGCCYNRWQHNRLIRRFTVLITHAQKCYWRFLFGGLSLHTISPRLKANVACKTVWLSLTPLHDADSQWHPTDSWNGWGPPDFWGL